MNPRAARSIIEAPITSRRSLERNRENNKRTGGVGIGRFYRSRGHSEGKPSICGRDKRRGGREKNATTKTPAAEPRGQPVNHGAAGPFATRNACL
ncbi:hypothetical protein PUN28_000677 [Cardiocondyla obscurior]|uniref:Ribosomal protein L2 n=1 Tax=Cardiocondyla obscurior TaxID=286306 RepID=A0AAW2H0P6_9HYME